VDTVDRFDSEVWFVCYQVTYTVARVNKCPTKINQSAAD